MSDAQIIWRELGGGDIQLAGYDLAREDGLQTAVLISLFTDRRAAGDDPLPGAPDDRRGWWADAWPEIEGDRIGSRLWLLAREKQLASVVQRAREYAEEALQWLVDDGIAAQVEVSAAIVRQGVLGLQVRITRPDASAVDFRFYRLWESV